MRNADFHSPCGRLHDDLRALENAWMETQENWDDSVSQQVEDDFLLPIAGEVRAMLDTVEKLSGVMSKAERACMHPREQGSVL